MFNNKNYSKFSQKKESANLEEIFPETEQQKVTVEEAKSAQENVEESASIIGFVDNCERLRVRKESNVDSEELCIINKLSEVVIDLDNSTDDFYKVKTSEGVEGYCMKKFITIK